MESISAKDAPVLVVDDDEGLLLSIKATLISSGLPEPALVSDSRRVIDLLRQHRYRLVLLDLMMPHMGGMEVLQLIREEFPDTDCVIVSAMDDVPTAVAAMSSGAIDYLVKPLNSERLVALVSSHLERYRFETPVFVCGPVPADNLLDLPVGITTRSVSAGYFLMLAPLPLGQHTIHFTGTSGVSPNAFSLDITYNLTVQPNSTGHGGDSDSDDDQD